MKHTPITCDSCGGSLTTIDYKVWGTKRFNPTTGSYDEDDSMGNADMEFLLPEVLGEARTSGSDVLRRD